LIKVLISQKLEVVPIRDFKIRLLSLKQILTPKSILGQEYRDFTRNSKSTNYNNYNSKGRADSILTKDIYSP
jgi:hypothetical protein